MYSRLPRIKLRHLIKEKLFSKLITNHQPSTYSSPQIQESQQKSSIGDVDADLEQAVYNGDDDEVKSAIKYAGANPKLPGLLHLALLMASKQGEYVNTHQFDHHDYDFKDFINGGMDKDIERNESADYQEIIEVLIKAGAKQYYKFDDAGFYYAYWQSSDPSPFGKTPAEYLRLIITKNPELADGFHEIGRILGVPIYSSTTATITNALLKQPVESKKDSVQKTDLKPEISRTLYETVQSQIVSTLNTCSQFILNTLFPFQIEKKQPIEANKETNECRL